MKSSNSKWVSLVSAIVIIVLISGCSAGSGPTEAPVPSKSTDTAQSPSPIKEEPAKIRLFISDNNQPIPSTTAMDIPTIKYLAEQTNTNLDIAFLPHGQYAAQLKLKFASGDMPDVYQTWGINNEETIPNGQVLALNELIEEFGPNLKKYIPQAAWDAVTVNGNIMGIPQPQEGNAPGSRIGLVRKDWLDKVGLSIPTTSDEYLNMLRAFRDEDPNENGMKDEIPFSMREKISWADNIFGMWGVNLDSYTLYNGEIIPYIIHPNTKLALEFLHTLWEEKLIDSEFLTNSGAIWQQKIFSDTVGAWNHQPSYAWFFQDQMNNMVQGKKTDVIAIPTPRGTGYTGPLGGVDQPVLKTYIVMKNAENPEAIVRMLDWMISEEGAAFAAFGIPGETYKKEGDRYEYDLAKDKTNPLYQWRSVLLNISSFNENISKELVGSDEAFNKLKMAFEIAQKEGIPNPNVTLPIAKALLDNPELGHYGTLFQEAAAKIILGNASLDSFDEFVEIWRKQGGDTLIQQKTEAYNANIKG